MPKQVKQLDRVVIRFAGDSGDGMQLTGDRFTSESAAFGNDLSTLAELPGRDPRAAGHHGRRLVVPGALRRPRHPHPGRRARRPRRDESGRAARQPRRHAPGQDDHRGQPRLHRTQPDQGRLRRQPARGRHAHRLRGDRDRPDRDDDRGGQGVRPLPQGRQPREEHVRTRAAVVDVRTADRDHDRVPRSPFRQGPGHPRRQRDRVQRGVVLRRDDRGVRGAVRDQARR